ncbi:small integral membrane protein 26 [Arvicanthis niloticus]|uniref:small integral membrane protein 26 n=1 Tax=Arvicanthis niloticus TaxID=61156 RepID=UPI001485C65B|nr:small integral membrane protein 26 [Arvicanthis niloticus]
MPADHATVWYRRMSILYALGAWSTLGSLFIFTRKQTLSDFEDHNGSRNETPLSTSEDSDLATERAEPAKRFYMETVVKYSEGPVSVTQMILAYLKSWTGGPGRQG